MDKIRILNIGHERVYNKKGKVIAYIKISPVFSKGDAFSVQKINTTLVTYKGEIPAYVTSSGEVYSPADQYIGSLKEPPRAFFKLSVVAILFIFLSLSVLQTTLLFKKMGMSLTEPEIPEVTVFDIDSETHWSGRMNINILGTKSICPGSTGTYSFVVKNQNAKPILHNVRISEVNRYHIPICYRIKIDDVYFDEEWKSLSQLNLNNIYLTSDARTIYYIEWLWFADVDDVRDTMAGQDLTSTYSIQIAVVAELA